MTKNKITKTLVRSKKTMLKYYEAIREREKLKKEGKKVYYPFLDSKKVVSEFKFWKIIENDFPYDNFAEKHHMIFPKREVSFSWDLLNKNEKEEFFKIKKTYISDKYEVVYENLPKSQSISNRFHLHLLILKRQEF